MSATSILPLQGEAVRLAPRAVFTIADAAGLQLACSEGELWVTLDHDPRDVILSAGESFFTTEHRRAIVYALSPARLTVRGMGEALNPAMAPRWTERLLAPRAA